MENRGPVLLGSSFALLITAWITFSLRLWVRGFILKTWGTDDWLMACSIALFTAYIISQAIGVSYGTGRHLQDLETSRAHTALVTWWLCELLYVGCTIFLKLSVGVFLHRIAINRWHLWIIRIMMVCTGVFGFAYFLCGVFTCWPVQSWWIRRHALTSKDYGSCINNDAVVGLTFAAGALNSMADFTFGLLPFFMIRDLNMPKKSKRLVAAILTFANIACVATIIRMPYVLTLYHTEDWLYATVDMVVWCTVEIGIGITAACFATLRPLLRIIFGLQASQWFPEQNRVPNQINTYQTKTGEPSNSSGNSYALEDAVPKLRPDLIGHYTEISSAGSKWSRGRTREKRDPRITERAMRDLYSNSDQEEEDQEELSTGPKLPVSVPLRGGKRAASPAFQIRKKSEFSYSVKDRQEDDKDDYDSRLPARPGRQPEESAQYAKDTTAQTTISHGKDRQEDDAFTLPLQTHGLDDTFTLPLQTHGLGKSGQDQPGGPQQKHGQSDRKLAQPDAD